VFQLIWEGGITVEHWTVRCEITINQPSKSDSHLCTTSAGRPEPCGPARGQPAVCEFGGRSLDFRRFQSGRPAKHQALGAVHRECRFFWRDLWNARIEFPPTDLRGADLRSARGISVEQLKEALLDSTTLLPKPLQEELRASKP